MLWISGKPNTSCCTLLFIRISCYLRIMESWKEYYRKLKERKKKTIKWYIPPEVNGFTKIDQATYLESREEVGNLHVESRSYSLDNIE